jgi:hypothetical protein
VKKNLKKMRLNRETLDSFGGQIFFRQVAESEISGDGCTVLTTCGGCTCESAA